jgi:hypothetical protein
VGDIGEAVANELIGLELGPKCGSGFDGVAPDGRTVQVKASGTGRGAVFRKVETEADHLLFFSFDFEACKGVVTYNAAERVVRDFLPPTWTGQLPVSLAKLRRADATVPDADRLPLRPVSLTGRCGAGCAKTPGCEHWSTRRFLPETRWGGRLPLTASECQTCGSCRNNLGCRSDALPRSVPGPLTCRELEPRRP